MWMHFKVSRSVLNMCICMFCDTNIWMHVLFICMSEPVRFIFCLAACHSVWQIIVILRIFKEALTLTLNWHNCCLVVRCVSWRRQRWMNSIRCVSCVTFLLSAENGSNYCYKSVCFHQVLREEHNPSPDPSPVWPGDASSHAPSLMTFACILPKNDSGYTSLFCRINKRVHNTFNSDPSRPMVWPRLEYSGMRYHAHCASLKM